jgi:hypothetical protein
VIREGVLRLGGGILGELLSADAGYRGPRVACGNGHEAELAGYRRKVFDTVVGPVTVRRAWYHCARCKRGRAGGHGLAPRDAELGVAGQSMSPGSGSPSRESSGPPRPPARRWPPPAGKPRAGTARARTAAPAPARSSSPSSSPRTSSTRRGYPVRDRASSSYIATFEPAATFADLVKAEGIRRDAGRARQMTIIGDGAAWIWGIATSKFPEATQVVDLYHAREHLHSLTRSLEFMLLDRKDEWLAARMEDLDYGDIDGLHHRPALRRSRQPVGSHLPQPSQPDTSRLTSRSAKMIFNPYTTVVHPRAHH